MIRRLFIAFAFGLSLISPLGVFAATIAGKVIRIIDGDTFVLLVSQNDRTKHQQRIRITTIDAPEERQPFYQVSKDYLGKLIHEQEVLIEPNKIDIYGRTVARVTLNGRDIGLEQINAGLAWYARAYASALTLEEQGYYLLAESRARNSRAGLWNDANPTPPWTFRANKHNQR